MNGCQGGESIAPRKVAWRSMPLLAVCLAACATTAPVDQIKYFSQAFGAVNAVEARRLILDGAVRVSQLIAAMRAAAPAMFKVLIEASAKRMLLLDETDALAVEVTRVEAYRVVLANYVVLLAKLEAAWKLTVAAANGPQGKIPLAVVVQQSAALKADADAARRLFSILRSGAMATSAR